MTLQCDSNQLLKITNMDYKNNWPTPHLLCDFKSKTMEEQAQVSKGNALNELAKILKIEKSEIICFGDNENDISMFKCAGVGVAMNNSSDFVKENANFVTLSNNDDGV